MYTLIKAVGRGIRTVGRGPVEILYLSHQPRTCAILSYAFSGELSEWLKEHDWKSCIRRKRILGSNPRLSARIFDGVREDAVSPCGGVAEWLNAAVSKTVYPPMRVRGFESLPLRQNVRTYLRTSASLGCVAFGLSCGSP